MKYWLLGAACVAYAIVVAVIFHFAGPTANLFMFSTYAMASVAGVVTAFAYAPRDLLRWAWLTFGAAYGIAFLSKAFIGDSTDLASFSYARSVLWSISIILFNVGMCTALALFARVWSGTGLSPPWRRWATLAFAAVALAIDHASLIAATRSLLTLQPQAFGQFASVTGDVVAIALVGPIFATMVALRGGMLGRPWLFLFLSILCWVLDDATPVMPMALALNVDIFVRPLALAFGVAAAVAQLWVTREVRAGLDRA
jgi:hypothetical protein